MLLFTNSKLHTGFQVVPKSNDLRQS